MCTDIFQVASIGTGAVEMSVTACVAENYASWQPPDEPLKAPPAQGAQAVMKTLYLLVQQLASTQTNSHKKGGHERHDRWRVQLFLHSHPAAWAGFDCQASVAGWVPDCSFMWQLGDFLHSCPVTLILMPIFAGKVWWALEAWYNCRNAKHVVALGLRFAGSKFWCSFWRVIMGSGLLQQSWMLCLHGMQRGY